MSPYNRDFQRPFVSPIAAPHSHIFSLDSHKCVLVCTSILQRFALGTYQEACVGSGNHVLRMPSALLVFHVVGVLSKCSVHAGCDISVVAFAA